MGENLINQSINQIMDRREFNKLPGIWMILSKYFLLVPCLLLWLTHLSIICILLQGYPS